MLGQFDGGVPVWPNAIETLGNDEVLDLDGVTVSRGVLSTPETPVPALAPSGAVIPGSVQNVTHRVYNRT